MAGQAAQGPDPTGLDSVSTTVSGALDPSSAAFKDRRMRRLVMLGK